MVLSSMVVRPVDAAWMTWLAVVYAGASIAGCLLVFDRSESAIRRFTVVLRVLGILAFVAFHGLACWEVVRTCRQDPLLAGGAGAWLLVLDYPLHAVASGWTCWLATALLSTLLLDGGRVRRWLPVVILPMMGAIVLAAMRGPKPDDSFEFRPYAMDRLEREGEGIHESNGHEDLMSTHPEIFPAVRYEDSVLACIVALALASGLSFRSRRAGGAGPVPEAPAGATGRLEVRALLLLIGAAVLLGLIRLLAVAQAVRWASPRTPPAEVVAALVQAVIPVLVYAAIGVMGIVAMRPWRRAEPGDAGAGLRPQGATSESPA
jgi:hypothetical protein